MLQTRRLTVTHFWQLNTDMDFFRAKKKLEMKFTKRNSGKEQTATSDQERALSIKKQQQQHRLLEHRVRLDLHERMLSNGNM